MMPRTPRNPRKSLCALPVALAGVVLAATPSLQAQDEKPLIRDFMGINAHTVQFPADLFAPTCRLVRDYHPMDWDVDGKSSNPTKFPLAKHIGWEDTSGKFRSWNAPVDWQEIYGSWREAGFEIDACIQFGAGLTPDKWDNLPKDAYRYGKAFAEYFGPSGEHKLVTTVEIGNEPEGSDAFTHEGYMTIFKNMARGLREGDPNLKIATATAEGVPPGGKGDGWSLPLDLFKDVPDLYDVINIHKYAFKEGWPTWERTYPENSTVDYRGTVQQSIDWRNQHAPDKEVWITEFGYDASTKDPDKDGPMAKWVDSTDLQQAQWIVRSFLMFSGMDLDRAYLYWFNDSDTPSFHAASGITRNLTPKPSYWAMRHLYQSLGDYRFKQAVEQEDETAYVYEYVHGEDPTRLVWVTWSPTGSGKTLDLTLDLPGKLLKAERMPTTDGDDHVVTLQPDDEGRVDVELTESPLYAWIQR